MCKISGVAQNHSALFMSSRERLPGLLHGQIYTYPSKRWRKKRRQYLMHYLHPKRGPRGDTEDGSEGIEAVTHVNDDSKDSVALKGKQKWISNCGVKRFLSLLRLLQSILIISLTSHI